DDLGRPKETHGFIAFEDVEQRSKRLSPGRCEVRIFGEHEGGVIARRGEQGFIAWHFGDAKPWCAALASSQNLTAAAKFEILFRDAEPVFGFLHHLEALVCRLTERRL